jgi:hypothetical protein
MRTSLAAWLSAALISSSLVAACSGDASTDSSGTTADAGASTTTSTGTTTTSTSTRPSTGYGTSTPPNPNPPSGDDAGAPPPDPPPSPPACAFENTAYGPGCRCVYESGGHSYILACDTKACVCDLDHGADLKVIEDPFESACGVAANGDWPGSIGCGYPTSGN